MFLACTDPLQRASGNVQIVMTPIWSVRWLQHGSVWPTGLRLQCDVHMHWWIEDILVIQQVQMPLNLSSCLSKTDVYATHALQMVHLPSKDTMFRLYRQAVLLNSNTFAWLFPSLSDQFPASLAGEHRISTAARHCNAANISRPGQPVDHAGI